MPHFQIKLRPADCERKIDVHGGGKPLGAGFLPAGETIFRSPQFLVDASEKVLIRCWDVQEGGELVNGIDATFRDGGPSVIEGMTLEPDQEGSDSSCEQEEEFARQEAERAAKEAEEAKHVAEAVENNEENS